MVAALHASQQPIPTPINHSNFSGYWTFSGDPGTLPIPGGAINNPNGSLRIGAVPPRLVIAQTADHLSVEEHRRTVQPITTVEYGLTGQPVKTQFFVEDGPAPCEIRSTWHQDKLVSTIAVVTAGESEPRRYTQTLSIGQDGLLAVQVQRDGTPDTRTLFYKRTK